MVSGRLPFEIIGGVPVVAAPAEIDIISAPSLKSAMAAAAVYGRGTLVVDMALTRFCDSSGLHALVAAHRRARADGGDLLVVLPGSAAARRVLALSGADRVIRGFLSVEEALAQAPAAS